MKKRTFLLLEILIALFLIAVCAIPLVMQPLTAYRREMGQLLIIEKERLADWTFSEVKEKFLNQEIPWAKIPPKSEFSEMFSLPLGQITIPGAQAKEIKRSYQLKCTGEKETEEGQITKQLEITIVLDENKYTFRLPIVKNP